MKKHILFFAVSIFSFFTCCSPDLIIQKGVTVDHLGICLEFDESIPEDVKLTFETKLQEIIKSYNSEKHAFSLVSCSNPNENSLRIQVENTKLVNRNQQKAGVIITSLGIITPVVLLGVGFPIPIAFYYVPHDISTVDIQLSDDLDPEPYALERTVSNSGFLRSRDKQVEKHGKSFDRFLRRIIFKMEREYIKSKKK